MFIKTKNLESKTRLEELSELRKLYCMKIMPKLNLIRDEKKGRDFAFYYLNRQGNKSDLEKHYYNQYSNQQEEELFRIAEEARLIDKNQTIVNEVIYPSIKPEYRQGLRDKELQEILANPNKKAEVERAIKAKYRYYTPMPKYEVLKAHRNRIGLVDTAIEEGIDLNNPEENNYKKLFDLTYSNPDPTEDEKAALTRLNGINEQENTFPLGHPNSRFFRYDKRISFADYLPDVPEYGFASFKTNRYEYRSQEAKEKFIRDYTRKYGNKTYAPQEGFLVPHLERNNEEAQEKIFKPNPSRMFDDRKKLYSNEMVQIEEFVNRRVEQDSLKESEDVTEEEFNQALYEAQYQKPIDDSDEYKRLGKRTKDEIKGLFKIAKIVPDEFWDHEKIPRTRKSFIFSYIYITYIYL